MRSTVSKTVEALCTEVAILSHDDSTKAITAKRGDSPLRLFGEMLMSLTLMRTALLLQPESCNMHQCSNHPLY